MGGYRSTSFRGGWSCNEDSPSRLVCSSQREKYVPKIFGMRTSCVGLRSRRVVRCLVCHPLIDFCCCCNCGGHWRANCGDVRVPRMWHQPSPPSRFSRSWPGYAYQRCTTDDVPRYTFLDIFLPRFPSTDCTVLIGIPPCQRALQQQLVALAPSWIWPERCV